MMTIQLLKRGNYIKVDPLYKKVGGETSFEEGSY
jgi:hypothetical protein